MILLAKNILKNSKCLKKIQKMLIVSLIRYPIFSAEPTCNLMGRERWTEKKILPSQTFCVVLQVDFFPSGPTYS